MDARLSFIVKASFVFAMLLATSANAQYSDLPCATMPSLEYNLRPCGDQLTIICRDEISKYIFEQQKTITKECSIELVKMGRPSVTDLDFSNIGVHLLTSFIIYIQKINKNKKII